MIFQDGKVITSLCTCLYVHVVGLLLVHPITLNNPSMIFHDEKVNISLCTYNVCHTYVHVIGLLLVQPITLEARGRGEGHTSSESSSEIQLDFFKTLLKQGIERTNNTASF